MSVAVGDMQSVGVAGWWYTSSVPSAPSAPTITVANTGTGTSATVTVDGDAGVTNRLYYRKTGEVAWTTGLTCAGDGTITQTGLTPGTIYYFVVVSDNAGVYSLPSNVVSCLVIATGTLLVVEIIREAIALKLEELVTAGTGSDLLVLTREGLPEELQDKLLVLCQREGRDLAESPLGKKDRGQTFAVACVKLPDDGSADSIDQLVNALAGAVESKLMEDPYFGGYASTGIWDSKVLSRSGFGESEAVAGAWVTLDVFYRTLEFDPYTIG